MFINLFLPLVNIIILTFYVDMFNFFILLFFIYIIYYILYYILSLFALVHFLITHFSMWPLLSKIKKKNLFCIFNYLRFMLPFLIVRNKCIFYFHAYRSLHFLSLWWSYWLVYRNYSQKNYKVAFCVFKKYIIELFPSLAPRFSKV